ncbi:hypothetical protein D3C84_1219890 [compost metagenome]
MRHSNAIGKKVVPAAMPNSLLDICCAIGFALPLAFAYSMRHTRLMAASRDSGCAISKAETTAGDGKLESAIHFNASIKPIPIAP